MAARTDERVTKRRVTCRSVSFVPGMTGPKGEPVTQTWEKVDFVRPDYLDAYVTAARTMWQEVTVSDEPDAGPAGYDGASYIPATIPVVVGNNPDGTRRVEQVPFPHPDAGTYYPATDCGPKCKHAPEGAHVVYISAEG